jgi:protein disulfide-isomerase A1
MCVQEGRSTALFVNVPSTEAKVMGYFGITEEMLPTAILVHMPEGGMKKFKWPADKELTAENFEAFLADYTAGSLKPFLKSDPAPDAAENEAAAVKVVTGSNFEDLVVNSDKDVLLEVYAPWYDTHQQIGVCSRTCPFRM